MKTNAVHIIPTGNISSIINNGMTEYTHEYGYDIDSRLVSDISSGTFIDINLNPVFITNDYSVSYSPSGKITNKTLQGQSLENYGANPRDENHNYEYKGANKQQMSGAYESVLGMNETFGWDHKGNMSYHSNDVYLSFGERRLCWSEDNRLQAFSDQNNGAYYGYDASGERAYKLTGPTMYINQNGLDLYSPIFQTTTIYASPLITIRYGEYTKHYFEESKRICSAIGNGGLIDIDGSVGIIDQSHEDLKYEHEQGVEATFQQCQGIGIINDIKDLYSFLDKFRDPQVNPDEPTYYFTSDHLGSSSYITTDNGQHTQTIAYMPYGEDWVNLNNNLSFETQYRYNGKERDLESGYYNYGARYYGGNLPIWISVDPLSDKYPHQTNYVYCSNNPIMIIDPDGMDEWEVNSKGYIAWKNNHGGEDNNTLFAIDGKGNRVKDENGNYSSLSLGKSNIFSQLYNGKKKVKRVDAVGAVTHQGVLRSATSDNKKDMAKTFMFLSQNTDVEWSLYASNEGGKSNYGLGTFQWNDLSPSSSQVGLTGNISSMIHSHPNPKNYNSEVGSMDGDRSAARRTSYNYFMFAPSSGNFYQIGNQKGNIIPKGKVNNFQQLMKYMR